MIKISAAFEKLASMGECALIPYFMVDYPNRKQFVRLLMSAQASGADLLEIGIPFSDPIADGPMIQYAGRKALREGASLRNTLALLKDISADISIPVVLMSYFNPVYRFGSVEFFYEAAVCGVSGVIIPDLGLEESIRMLPAVEKREVDLIQFVAPTTPEDRIPMISAQSRGFLYLLSVTGITGTRPKKRYLLKDSVSRVRRHSGLSVCVGFGVSRPEQAADAASAADGVIVGSALVELIRDSSPEDSAVRTAGFLSRMKAAMPNKGASKCRS